MTKKIISMVLVLVAALSIFTIAPDAAIQVKFTRNEINLYVLQTYKPSMQGNTDGVTYDSTNGDVAIVDENGEIMAISPGRSQIIASINGKAQSKCTVNVLEGMAPESISISDQSLTLVKGSNYKLRAEIKAPEGTDNSAYFYSSDEKIATVDANGNIKAIKEGSTVITAETSSSAVSVKCVLKVVADGVASANINISGILYSIAGEKKKSMVVELKNGETSVKATTDDEGRFFFDGVESKSYSLNVYKDEEAAKPMCSAEFAVSPYDMNISCIINGKELVVLYQDKNTNTADIKDITLEKSTLMMEVGEFYDMTYTVRPSNLGTPVLRCTSSDNDVASVDADGRITAIKQGNATVNFSTLDGRITKSCDVTVTSVNSNENSWLIIAIEAVILVVVFLIFFVAYRRFIYKKEKAELSEEDTKL